MLLHSSHEDENALMFSKQARKALVGWESHGSRIIKASFTTKKEGITMNVIQCYAPTNNINSDDKDQFNVKL
ncbi:unnamed protein product [Schistosoma margrebowiei]|uniref:Uncharacterized protein n=1 Tax=Schistosoma margrebowiei TaxID=48269 RepID=A0A183M355_9TREM|nr:unnamed protein product [Schistosoma margrebowiei]